MRTYSEPVPMSGGSFCHGPDQDYQMCTDGMCQMDPGGANNRIIPGFDTSGGGQGVHKNTHLIHSSQGRFLL